MTNRVICPPQDFQKMCKQAERDHESKKLVVLIERVKRQIEERQKPAPTKAVRVEPGVLRLPSRSVPFER